MNTLIQISNNMKAPPIREKLDRSELTECYRLALKIAGVKNIDPEDVSLDVTLTAQMLEREYPSMTLKEVRYATEKGSGGFYGEFHGVNPKTFMNWIRSYRQSTEWKEARKLAKEQKALPQPKQLSQEQMQEMWEEAKTDYLTNGKIKGELVLYNLGRKLGYIQLLSEVFIEQVKESALLSLKSRVEALKQERLINRRTVHALKEVIEAEPDERSKMETWQDQCKREAVKLTFKKDANT